MNSVGLRASRLNPIQIDTLPHLVLGAAYTLWLVKRVIYGEVANDKVAALKDLNGREFLVLGALAVAVLLVGLWPAPLLDVMRASTQHLAQQLLVSKIAP